MTERTKYERVLSAVCRFLVIFAVVAFFITSSLMLFITIMSEKLSITLTSDGIEQAAKLTLLNVIGLTAIFTVIDLVRQKFTVDKPAARIIESANRIKTGDFSVRIKRRRAAMPGDRFAAIESCLNDMAEQLSGTETLRSDFIANVSHELKTPLSVIKNYATMLKNPDISEDERLEYLDAIDSSSAKLSVLVTNILKLSKLENSRITPKPQVFDLGEHVAECFLSFEEVWEKKGLDISTDLEDGVTVSSDPEILGIIWNNLISNAIKFTESGGKVRVEVKSENGIAVVRILDTGIGMSAETGSRIFEKFYQGDTSRAGEGNGLGLALVKEAVSLVGADISVESAPERGTVFTVRIKEISLEG